jgi:hypothetical protein
MIRRIILLLVAIAACSLRAETVRIAVPKDASARVKYGVQRLTEALVGAGLQVELARADATGTSNRTITVGPLTAQRVQAAVAQSGVKLKDGEPGKEGFVLSSAGQDDLVIAGADDSGALYGCIELAHRIHDAKALPKNLRVIDHPAFGLRGPCIGMQKTYILPGRHVYEYPYTSDLFPFFYDRDFWREYLDFLADNRMNTLYLWSGHPFASLVKVPEYPYALEVSEQQYEQNVAMFRYITEECDKRGIWLVQMFYNIILSKPFAEHNHLPTQLKAPVPIAADYTRKSIAEFVKQYPHVGLMPCLGEALQGTPNQIEWATQVILPGVHDGMKAAGLTEEPPVVFRTHAMNPEAVIPEAFKVYSNLYTETKYNGESLTTWQPRGKGQATHLAMSKLGPHLVNIHILSNLEPFRYGDQQFIQKSMQAARDRLGASGVHLYPLSYWNWPDAPDKTTPPLKQWRRDWIWFEAWARYAWNPDIDPQTDRAYWVRRLTEMYGNADAAGKILDAYNAAGECAPRIIRRFGITEGNRQTMSLGMTLDELVRPEKYGVLPDLWQSQSPEGERLPDYVEKELAHQPHVGETPPQIIREILDYSQRAVDALAAAAPEVTKNRDEFLRLQNDAACIRAMSQNYAAKANAALYVLRYQHTHDLQDMEKAQTYLAESLEHFSVLERLTRDTYWYANSMQTAQRRIPVVGGEGGKPANYHWSQLLPVYQKELADFDAKVAALKKGGAAAAAATLLTTMHRADFTLLSRNAESYTVKVGNSVFTDRHAYIQSVTSELDGLKGVRFSDAAAKAGKLGPIKFSTTTPVRVLIGYVQSDDPAWRKAPQLETDALAAEQGGAEPLILDAAQITGLPKVIVYALSFGPGTHELDPRGTGSYLVLGVVTADDAAAGK